MVALRSRRLEKIFGAPLDAVAGAHVHGLVTARVPEMFDLEFKEAHYGRSDSEKRKLAGDVAAMANAAGGVILIGIAEDEQGCAAAAPGVDYTEAEKLQIQQVVAAGISAVPTFGVETIPDDLAVQSSEDASRDLGTEVRPQHGFILIAVLRTTSAPHAALIDEKLRFPVRSGTTTRYLSQPEVAAAYAERFAGAARQTNRIAQVEHDAFRRLDRESGIWMVVTLVPDIPGDMSIATASFNEFRQQTMQQSALIIPAAVSLNRIRVGRRRFLVDGGSGTSLARWVSLELHADGAGTYGFQIPDYTPRSSLQFEPDGLRTQLVDDEWVAVAVLSGLLRLGQHARDLTAASGNAVVRATLLPAMTAESLEMASARGGFAESSSASSVPPDDLVVAEAVVELDSLALPGPELIKVAAALINELGQAFGMAEMGQLSRDGAVRRRYFSHLQSQLVAWAEQHQIEVTDDHLPQ